MTRAVPAVLTRAAFVDQRGILTREGALFLDALRSAVGGDSAEVTPVEPLGALLPVAGLAAASTAFSAALIDLGPVGFIAGDADLAPVAAADCGADLGPVAIPA